MSRDKNFSSPSRHRLSSTLINPSSSPGPFASTSRTAFNTSANNDDSQLFSDDLNLDSLPTSGRIRNDGGFVVEEDPDENEQILETLTRHWLNERNAPDILNWQGSLVETVLDRLHAQVRSVPIRYYLIDLPRVL